jgi:hypothetical protein
MVEIKTKTNQVTHKEAQFDKLATIFIIFEPIAARLKTNCNYIQPVLIVALEH